MTTTIDRLFDVADLVTDEEREWQLRARELAQTRIAPIIDRASLVVYASGTFARGDGKPIHGIPYGPNGLPDFAAAVPAAGLPSWP